MDPQNPPVTVAVIGDALLDVMVRPSEPMRRGGDVPAAIGLAAGGQGANVAVRLARRGVGVRLACGLGPDAAGGLVRGALEAEGVALQPVPVAATGAVVVHVSTDGERAMMSQRAAFLAGVDVAALTSGAAWTVVSGYGLTDPGATTFARHLAAAPGRRALLGSAVPEPDRASWVATAVALRPDLVILNEAEAEALDATATLVDAVVLVTSAHGVVAAGPDVSLRVAAPVVDVVDATGAGDAFAASVIAGLLHDGVHAAWPPPPHLLEAALREALRVAARVVREIGAQARVAGEPAAARA